MSRLGSRGITVIVSFLVSISLGCGGGVNTTPDQVVTPGIVTLSPQPDVSLEIGNTVSFTASAQNSGGTPLTPSPFISFVSSNPAVIQVAASGLACAGKWDSLTNPQICAPGPVGTAVVTATSGGVSSPPATVHVHQHIDSVLISPVPTTTPTPSCLSKGNTLDYQVTAFNRCSGSGCPPSGLIDITDTVGPFNWNAANQLVATVSTTASGLQIGQSRVTAVNPGLTNIFATVTGVTSPPVQFMTCPVKSISLVIQNTDETSFTVASGAKSITATVTDSTDTEITGVNLTWSTSDAAAFTASGTTSGTASSVKAGSATIIASCLPPNCNIGFSPPRAIYPENVITGTATGTGTAQNTSLWVASTECGVLNPTTQVVTNSDDCISVILPIDTSNGITGVGTDLPVLPNSIQFDRQSAKAYLGTDTGRLGTVGLSIVTPGTSTQVAPTVAALTSAPGKILAISPNGSSVIVSDTMDTPNQVFVVTSSALAATLPITGATAAAFAPDNSKAYIVATSSTPTPGCITLPCGILYVYSPTEALKKIVIGPPQNDVTFLSNGAFAYLAGGITTSGLVSVRKTCDNDVARASDNSVQDKALTDVPLFIKSLPDARSVIAFNNHGLDLISVDSTPIDCQPSNQLVNPEIPGLPNVVNGSVTPFSFGLGNLTPTQFIVSSSGTRAYILASNQSNIIVFNIDSHTTSTIQLSGSSIPLRASLSTDGNTLYVIARDLVTKVNSIHVVDTTINTDVNQILPSQSLCHARTGVGGTFTCDVNLIAVKP